MSKHPTVLIIEDDPVFRRVLSFTVAKSGFSVETANDGEMGFERLMKRDVDFFVTDFQMPKCGGLELLQRLKQVPDYQRPSAILCTAKGLELDTEQLKKDFDLSAVMHKPFSPRKLSDLIAKCLEEEKALAQANETQEAMVPEDQGEARSDTVATENTASSEHVDADPGRVIPPILTESGTPAFAVHQNTSGGVGNG